LATAPRPRPLTERVPLIRDRPWLALALTLAAVAAATLLRFRVDAWLPSGFPYVTFFPAVILVSFVLGARAGSIAAGLCGLAAWYWFIPPAGFALGQGTVTALVFYLFVVATDIALVHWMQRANAGLARERERSARLAETRELLFSELQHRVSNNLQVAAALLALQKRKVEGEPARAALDEASRRLALIGRISRQLYDAGGEQRSVRAFLEPLCADVVEASGRDDVAWRVEGDGTAPLASERAVPLALIVAEAISNAIEHGFADRGGEIVVALVEGEDMLEVRVEDNGRGLPPGFDTARSDSLGLRIATMLATQLNGRFAMAAGERTAAVLRVPV
jgi:two-component system, sensor histidine kinase PdtaS